MRVFVAGGTGAIGGHTIPALVREGHTVTALARSPAKAAALTAQGATAVPVSLFDRSALTAVLAGHDAVVNLATAIPPMTRFLSARAWRRNDRVRTDGSAAVVDAALAAGVGRLVQESVSMLYRDQGARWVDEDAPVDRYPMASGNLAAEASAHRFSEAGGTGIVLRFGWFYAPSASATHGSGPRPDGRRDIPAPGRDGSPPPRRSTAPARDVPSRHARRGRAGRAGRGAPRCRARASARSAGR